MLLESLLLLFLVLYLLQSLVFFIGLNKKFDRIPLQELPDISIIVAARNEEKNILDCLKSLDALEYPAGKYEILIVNDRSTDRTGEIIDGFIKDKEIFRAVEPSPPTDTLKGKANAINSAVKIASGEVILTTDADCMVSKDWAITVASYYKDDVGFVGGYTTQLSGNIFFGMQMMDFLYLLAVAGSTINLKRPLSCIGNNMSYRKSAYEDTGGYAGIPFSVTEDFKLLKSIAGLRKYRLIYPLDKGGLVTSKPCPDAKSLYHQKKRWGVGGLDSAVDGFAVMGIGVAAKISMILVFIFFNNSAALLGMALAKILADMFILFYTIKRLGLSFNFIHFIVFEIYYTIYVPLLPVVLLLNRDVVWKGRKF